MKMPSKYTYAQVLEEFERRGCELLSKEYVNNRTKLLYVCANGHTTTCQFGNFKKGHGCVECRKERNGDNRRLSYEKVKQVFEKEGCQLLTDHYENNVQVLEYICSCGNVSKTSYANFSRGARCRKCGYEKLRKYRNKEDKPSALRSSYEYRKWRDAVLKRDANACKKCGVQDWTLNAHHVRNFHSAENLRFDVNNGVTLCGDCHNEFHSIYGNRENDGTQIMEFLFGKVEDNPIYDTSKEYL